MVNFVPRPGSLCTSIVPPCAAMIFRVVARPSPLPLVFVVWNGRNIFGSCSGAMPSPVSITSRTDQSFAVAPADQRERAAVGHRLFGVQHQVQKALLEQVAVEVHRRQVGGREPLDLDVVLPRGRGQEVDHPRDDGVERRRLGGEVVDAGEAEKVGREIDEFLAFAGEPRDAVEGAALARGLGVLEVFGEQLEVERQGADVVLDLVDEPAREFGQFAVLLRRRCGWFQRRGVGHGTSLRARHR